MRTKKMRSMTILGVSIGTRTSGVAVICDNELIHWQTHSFQGKWGASKAKKIQKRFEKYLTQYQALMVIVKVPPVTHQSTAILTIIKGLLSFIQLPGCMVQVTTKAEIKREVPEITNRETLMDYVTKRYPILKTELKQELDKNEPYYIRMFEAVLAAHLYKDKIP